mmetsp:Transcript_48250/g.139791  ORF Transcript_48250/g.139791 Transcript_48250/m.139791 type:complete len:211 (+) Transcript_48250:743-1375(+)
MPEVVRLLHPGSNLGPAAFHDVSIDGIIDQDGEAHAPGLGSRDELVHDSVPVGRLVVDPQAVQAGVLHFVKLPVDDPLLGDVVRALGARVEGVAVGAAPVVVPISARVRPPCAGRVSVGPEEPRHVVRDVLRGAELEGAARWQEPLRDGPGSVLAGPYLHVACADVEALVGVAGPPDWTDAACRQQELHVPAGRVLAIPELHIVSVDVPP